MLVSMDSNTIPVLVLQDTGTHDVPLLRKQGATPLLIHTVLSGTSYSLAARNHGWIPSSIVML